jgi:hypothetical protein
MYSYFPSWLSRLFLGLNLTVFLPYVHRVAPCGSSVRNKLCVVILVPIILRLLPYFWKTCVPLSLLSSNKRYKIKVQNHTLYYLAPRRCMVIILTTKQTALSIQRTEKAAQRPRYKTKERIQSDMAICWYRNRKRK